MKNYSSLFLSLCSFIWLFSVEGCGNRIVPKPADVKPENKNTAETTTESPENTDTTPLEENNTDLSPVPVCERSEWMIKILEKKFEKNCDQITIEDLKEVTKIEFTKDVGIGFGMTIEEINKSDVLLVRDYQGMTQIWEIFITAGKGELKPGLFKDSSKLSHIVLSSLEQRVYGDLTHETFADNPKVNMLFLRGDLRINMSDTSLLSGMKNLTVLILESARMTGELSMDLFIQNESLYSIKLKGANVTGHLDKRLFSSLKVLQDVTLDLPGITGKIPTDLFSGEKPFEDLILKLPGVQDPDLEALFANLPKLKELSLEFKENYFLKLTNTLFSRSAKLEILELTNMKFADPIDNDFLKKNKKLKKLVINPDYESGKFPEHLRNILR